MANSRPFRDIHDDCQHFATPWHRTGTRAKSEDDLEGVYRSTLGSSPSSVDLFRCNAIRCPILYGRVHTTRRDQRHRQLGSVDLLLSSNDRGIRVVARSPMGCMVLRQSVVRFTWRLLKSAEAHISQTDETDFHLTSLRSVVGITTCSI
jgi:hypothetical protein